MCPSTNFIIPLWPTYFMPHNNTCTFSPTALKFNNNYPSVITKHLHSLNITTQKKHKHYMSIYTNINKKTNLPDYHHFTVAKLTNITSIPLSNLIVKSSNTTKSLSRSLIHQRLAHCNHRKLDLMCRQETLSGLPKLPLPLNHAECPICLMSKFANPPKGKTLSTDHLHPGKLLHIDYSFWDLSTFHQRFHFHATYYCC
jgi:hypothetical protein